MVKIDFSFETKYGVFSDALNLSDEEAASLTADDIEAMKQQRLSSWIAIIEAPEVIVAPEVIEAPIDQQV